jgi:hypothetical protein
VVRALKKGKTMPAPESRYWQPKVLDAGVLQPEISSFRLHLAAEGKAAKTVNSSRNISRRSRGSRRARR